MIEDEEGLVDDRIPTTSRGLWAISEIERSMKALLSFAKSHRFDAEFIDEGSTSMDLFEAWKKEYKVQYFKTSSNYQKFSFTLILIVLFLTSVFKNLLRDLVT